LAISQTFYEQLFCTTVFGTAFFYLQFGFVIFWQKNIGEKQLINVGEINTWVQIHQ